MNIDTDAKFNMNGCGMVSVECIPIVRPSAEYRTQDFVFVLELLHESQLKHYTLCCHHCQMSIIQALIDRAVCGQSAVEGL